MKIGKKSALALVLPVCLSVRLVWYVCLPGWVVWLKVNKINWAEYDQEIPQANPWHQDNTKMNTTETQT